MTFLHLPDTKRSWPLLTAMLVMVLLCAWSNVIGQRRLSAQEGRQAQSLSDQANKLVDQGKFDEAILLLERVLSIEENALGPDHPNVATALGNLALVYRDKGDLDRAASLYERALAINDRSVPRDEGEIALSLRDLASIYYMRGEHARAEPLYKRALAIREHLLGPESLEVAQSLVDLATLYRDSEDPRAEALFTRALQVYEKAPSKDGSELVEPLIGLGTILTERGDYEKASAMLERALNISRSASEPNPASVGASLVNLAYIQKALGDYAKAESLYQQAIPIFEAILGPDRLPVAIPLRGLAVLYEEKGDYARAESLYTRVLSIREKWLPTDHPQIGISLGDLARLYVTKGNLSGAEPMLQRTVAILEKAEGPEHSDLAGALSDLAWLYVAKGDLTRAEPLLQRSLSINERALGPDHPNVAKSAINLGTLYFDSGQNAKAEPLFQRALTINEKALGPDHPDVAMSLGNLGFLSLANNNTAQAIKFLTRATEIREHALSLTLSAGSEEQRRLYLATLASETDGIISLHANYAPNNSEAARLALTTILRRKGRVLDVMSNQISALRRRLNTRDQALLDQLSATRAQLATLVLKGSGKSDAQQHQQTIIRLAADEQRLEADISARIVEFRLQSQTVTLAQVQHAIPADAALVEIVSYRPWNSSAKTLSESWGPAHYVVYVLRREGNPSWVDLGEASHINRDVAKLRGALRVRQEDVRAQARIVDDEVMRPVRKLLGEVHQVFLSPDGALNLVPFAALIDEQDHYLVQNYTFTYVTSGRDLLRLQAHIRSRQEAVVIGNPQFDLGEIGASESAASSDSGAARRSRDFQKRFEMLQGTAEEAVQLNRILPRAKVFTGPQATESAIKQVHGPSILHVATHGFFLADLPRDSITGVRQIGLVQAGSAPASPEAASHVENPLLRSGLALAGANSLNGGNGEDGILTALEAAGLDLAGTKLVVLSACETGLGDVQNGEGVYGLRRALVLAGAESEMMSLWKVDDEATRDLMVQFYKSLEAGAGRSEALRQVQLNMLKTADRAHPFYWASFILSGDWRAIGD